MRNAGLADAALLAALHTGAFNRPWSQDAFEVFLGDPTVFGLIIGGDGFILWRTVAGEAEILTLAVSPAARRQGIARALLAGAVERAAKAPAEWMFLEVSEQNSAALALYQAAGFQIGGLRKGYYESENQPENALLMRLSLTAPPPPTISGTYDLPPRS
jgi:ribosomal-protein-alanine N-acetyltransferase